MDGQLLFLQEDHYWLLFLPSMFVLLVLLVFFSCLSTTAEGNCWNQGRDGQGSMFLLNQTAECQKHLRGFGEHFLVVVVHCTGSELFLAGSAFNFFAFCVDSLIAFLNTNVLNSYG